MASYMDTGLTWNEEFQVGSVTVLQYDMVDLFVTSN